MKRYCAVLLCLMIIFTLASCKENSGSKNDSSQDEASTVVSSETSESDEKTSSEEQSSFESSSKESSSESSSKTSSSKNSQSSTSSSNKTENSSNVSSTPNKETTEETVEDLVGADGEELVFGEDYGGFGYAGTFESYAADGDLFYMVFSTPNVLVCYNSAELELVSEKTLPGSPAEIQVDQLTISISYPQLKKIVIYDKSTFSVIREIFLNDAVSSFCIDGDIVYYSQHSQHCKVYRTNLVTGQSDLIVPQEGYTHYTYYYPKLLLNKEDGRLYIGESQQSSCALYCYDTADMSLVQRYLLNNGGTYNMKRTMYLVDGELYWAGLSFDPKDISIKGQYGGVTSKYMYYVDENFVFMNGDVYDRKTYQLLARAEQIFKFMCSTDNMSLIIVNESGEHVVAVVPY